MSNPCLCVWMAAALWAEYSGCPPLPSGRGILLVLNTTHLFLDWFRHRQEAVLMKRLVLNRLKVGDLMAVGVSPTEVAPLSVIDSSSTSSMGRGSFGLQALGGADSMRWMSVLLLFVLTLRLGFHCISKLPFLTG